MTDTDRPEVDDPRVLALAQARQQMAHENQFNAGFCPPWDGLTEQEQRLSLLDARNYLRAALKAGLLAAPVVVPSAPAARAAILREAADAAAEKHRRNPWTTAADVIADVRRMAAEAQEPECSASRSGHCLREAESEIVCDTEAGECVHGATPAVEARQAEAVGADQCSGCRYVPCGNCPPAVEAQQPETQAFVCKCPAEICHCGHHAAVSQPAVGAQQPKEA